MYDYFDSESKDAHEKPFSLTKFMPDTTYPYILHAVSDKSNCNIGNIVSRFIRSKMRIRSAQKPAS
jgi:hypothetical protein